jgi:hypothetical protein
MSEFTLPETRYALSGDVNIAYQVIGAGPVDIIMVPGVVRTSNTPMRRMDTRRFYAAFRHSRGSSLLTSEGRDYPIEFPAHPRWSSAWTTFAPSWKRLVRSVR